MAKTAYMIVCHSHAPTAEGKIKHTETVHFTDTLPRDLQQTATYVIDIINQTVKKNRFGMNEGNEIYLHYYNQYKDKADEAIRIFKEKNK